MKLDPDYAVHLVETLDDALDFKRWMGERRHGDYLGVDIETSGVNLGRDKIRLCQFGDLSEGWALGWEDWAGVCKDVLPRYDRPVIGHNWSFDSAFLKRDGLEVPQVLCHDSMIMAHIVNPVGWIGLKPLAAKLVGAEALMGKDDLSDAMRSNGWSWATVPIDHPAYWIYGVMDTSLAVAVGMELWKTVHPEFDRVYEVEMGCLHVLRDARLRGMAVDVDYCERTSAQMLSEMEGLRTQIDCDPGKDKQLREMVELRAQRGPLGSWWPFRTDTGEVSMDKEAIAYFEPEYPWLTPVKEWKKRQKLTGTYFNNLLRENVDGVVRPNIKQVAARTSRMSITDPALQTLPRGTEVRDAFVARPGHKILLADYEQMELRMLAYFAQAHSLNEAFLAGIDLHTYVAAEAFHRGDVSKVTKIERALAKGVQFGKIYGAGVNKIALTAGVPVETATSFLHDYDARFPEVKQFQMTLMQTMHERLHADGEMWVKSILGRRLIVDKDKPYVGVNYLCQCSATSDIIKLKVCELDAAGLGEYVRLPIHDELFFEVPDEDVEDARETVKRVMPEHQLCAPVPLTIDTDVVSKWGDHYR